MKALDLHALRDKLLAPVVEDRPAQATLMDLGLSDLSDRAKGGDDRAGRTLMALSVGNVAEASALLEDTATHQDAKASNLWITLGLLVAHDDPARALAADEQALVLAPSDPDARYGRAMTLIALGRAGAARTDLSNVLATTAGEPSLFYQHWARLHVALLDVADGKLGDARAALSELTDRLERFVAVRPIALDWERDLAVAWHRLGEAYVAAGDPAAGIAAHEKGLMIDERLVAADRTSGQWLYDIAYAEQVSGDAFAAKGDRPGALAHYRKSVEHVRLGLANAPDEVGWQRSAGALQEKIADMLILDGDLAQAKALLEQSIGVSTWLGRVAKVRKGYWHDDAARRETKLAVLLDERMHDLKGAIFWYDALRSLDAWLVRVNPESRPRRRDLAAAYRELGNVQARDGDGQAASESFGHVLDLYTELVGGDPTDMAARADLAATYERFGDAAEAAHDGTRALEIFKLDVATRKLVADAAPGDTTAQRAAGLASEKLGDAQAATGEKAAALQSYRAAATVYEAVLEADPRDASNQRALAVALNEAGCTELAQGDKVAALADFTRRQRLFDAIADAAPDDVDKQHERFLSAFQLKAVLESAGRREDALVLLRATRANAANVLSRQPKDDVSLKTQAWVEEELSRQQPTSVAASPQADARH